MVVRVRLFAALREAAGEEFVEAHGTRVPEILDELCARFGEPFRTRVSVASVLVDGDSVPRDADVAVPPGSEMVLLPPVSGGAGRHGP